MKRQTLVSNRANFAVSKTSALQADSLTCLIELVSGVADTKEEILEIIATTPLCFIVGP